MKLTVRALGLELLELELTTAEAPNLAPDYTATPVGFTGHRPDQGEPYA